MFKRTAYTLLTFGALVAACYSGSDQVDDRGLVISASDLDELAEGELLTVDLRENDAARFDLAEGPIELNRVKIVRPSGEELLLIDLIGLYGEVLGIDPIGAGEFTLEGAALAELAPLSTFAGGQALLLPSQSQALAQLPQIDRLSYDNNALPRLITGNLGTMSASDPASGALEFVETLAPALRLDDSHDFEVVRVVEDDLGMVHVRMQLFIDDLPVLGSEAIVHAEVGSGEIQGFQSQIATQPSESDGELIDGDAAAERASKGIEGKEIEVAEVTDLVYIAVGGQPMLAYAAEVSYFSDEGPELDIVYADARSGELLARHPQVHRAKNRQVYSANNGQSLPGSWKMSEGSPQNGDNVVQAAYDNAGTTYDYYKSTFNRDSFNNGGALIRSTVHYGYNYDNAFWNGQQMVYGDGGGQYFGPLALSGDIVVHELTHAVTQYEAGLVYQNESGALNEAMSDIFAASAQAWGSGGVSSATWKLAEDVWTPNTPGDAMRYMNNPTQDGQSRDYYPTRYTGSQDNGGVHFNSGIANLAYKLLVTGGTHPQGKTNVNVPGLGIYKAEQIFYRALSTYMTSNTNFEGARDATAQAAGDLYGASEVSAVHKAWDAVGVPGTPANDPPPNDPPPNDPPPSSCSGVPYSGSLSGKGAVQYEPNGTYYYSSKSGTHKGCMTGPANADFDLYLMKWNGKDWTDVAKSESPTSSESIGYSGSPGYYAWRVSSWSGSGSYTLSLTHP